MSTHAAAGSAIHPKVQAAAVGAGFAGAVTTIAVWIMESQGLDVPAEVAAAITTIISALVGFASGYQKPA